MTDAQRQALAEGEKAGRRYRLSPPPRAARGLVGSAAARRAGTSLEFRDYRDYQPGDDLRHVDWNAYARSDQLSLKLFREEVTPHTDIVVDASRSMALEDSSKEAATLGLAAFLAVAASNAGHSHSTWLLGDRLEPIANGNRPSDIWEGISLEGRANPGATLIRTPPHWRSHGVRLLISDLLWPGEPLAVLRHLAEGAALCVVVQVLARTDVEPLPGGNLRLVDAETQEVLEILVDAGAVRRYQSVLARHQESWHQACRQAGAVFTTVVAERLVTDWRLDALIAAEVLRVV
jgi:uncharacterized protein (DUF58 family)